MNFLRSMTLSEWIMVAAICGILATIVIPIVSDSVNRVYAGHVENMRHEVAHSETTTQTVVTSNGGAATVPTQRWQILISDGEHSSWWTVTEARFEEIKIGEWISFAESR